MKLFRSKRFKLLALSALFAAGLGFGAAQAGATQECFPSDNCPHGAWVGGCCDPA
ncbi:MULTISPECIES: hypothetical protein [Lysobacter]|uniref:Uncharacterized protein n=2 Tax=Lysobacter TaxID=68 RepID=A0A0S2DAD5_LYSEN|nr:MULTISPECIES: hypothetical protein [Lysobacter]ALN55504.1 hypothetical protein GLE_0145 [Lysobacter enzymogenes]QQQ01195.1 hypothetical protein JHW41_24620 [Lysobacter enzymogenes]UZW60468.1 hypothetical protein BV903_024950 [Lysobacter enzymogenes]WMT04352.1 hypothetical protein RDV84_05810 [Lysobacter yananisis]